MFANVRLCVCSEALPAILISSVSLVLLHSGASERADEQTRPLEQSNALFTGIIPGASEEVTFGAVFFREIQNGTAERSFVTNG